MIRHTPYGSEIILALEGKQAIEEATLLGLDHNFRLFIHRFISDRTKPISVI
jgi:hypothetical protein